MTVSNQEFSPEEDIIFEEEDYPTLFGIILTPRNSGILCGIAGLLGALYILMSFILPAQKEYQKIKTDMQTKEEQVKQLDPQKIAGDISRLESQVQQSENLKRQIIAWFSNTQALNTVLLDISNLVKAKGAKLISFKPLQPEPQLVQDNSLGKPANAKMKRQSFALKMEGNFAQIQAVLTDIERLQFMVMVNQFNSAPINPQVKGRVVVDKGEITMVPIEDRKLRANFNVDIVMPVTEQ